jgi:hypothetical protein
MIVDTLSISELPIKSAVIVHIGAKTAIPGKISKNGTPNVNHLGLDGVARYITNKTVNIQSSVKCTANQKVMRMLPM